MKLFPNFTRHHLITHANFFDRFCQIIPQVAQAHSERSAYNNLLIFAYFISRQNIRVCMEMQLRRSKYHKCEIVRNINGSPCFCVVLIAI